MTKKIVTILVLSYIVMGCNSSTKSEKNLNEELKLGGVVYTIPQKIKLRNRVLKINTLQKKAETSVCSISGTVDIEVLSNGTLTVLYNECVNHNVKTGLLEYYNGKVQTNAKRNQISFYGLTEILDYENYPKTSTYYDEIKISYSFEDAIEETELNGTLDVYENGDIIEKMSYSDFMIKTNSINNSYYMAGYFSDTMRCYSEEHIYKTKNNDWLVKDTLNSKNWSSGTLYIDDIKYVYDGESVTVTKNNQQRTFTQQELRDEYDKNKKQMECLISYL